MKALGNNLSFNYCLFFASEFAANVKIAKRICFWNCTLQR